MKKWIAIALAAVMALSLCACAGDGGETSEKDKKVTVSMLTEIRATEKNSDGENDTMKVILEYDKIYNLIGAKTYQNDKLVMEGTYNKDITKPLVQQEYDEDGNKAGRSERTYDENGNELTRYYYDEDGDVSWGYAYTYDADGNVLTEKYYDRDELASTYTYTYNADGKVLTFVTTWPDSDEAHYRKYAYNQQGDLVTETHGYDDQVTGTTTYDHVYSDGKLVTTTGYEDGEKFQMIQYDKDGNKTLECEYANGNETSRTEYTYENGKMIKQVRSSGGEERYKQVNTYNADGKLTERSFTYSDGETSRQVYSYNETGDVIGMKLYDGDDLESEYTLTYARVTVSKDVAKRLEAMFSMIGI